MLKTYKHTYHLGDMPGDQCVDWWTQEDWDKWAKHVEELKASGDYGKEEEVFITIMDDSRFDTPYVPNQEAYSFKIMDLGKT